MSRPSSGAAMVAGSPAAPDRAHASTLLADPFVLAALAVALALYLWGLDRAPLWLDEVETANWAVLTPDQVWRTIFERQAFGRYDTRHLPLYFVIVNVWTHMAGLSAWTLRLPSAVFGVAAVGLVAAFVGRLTDRRAARVSAWLAAISPFMLHHAQEARMYSAVATFAALSLLLLLRHLDGADRRLGWSFVLANAAMLCTHYYGIFLTCAELTLLFVLRRRQWTDWVPAAAATTSLAAVLVFVALFLTKQSSGEIYPLSWLAAPGVVWGLIAGYGFLPSAAEMHVDPDAATSFYLPIAGAMALPIAWLVFGGARALTARNRIVLGICCLYVFVGPFLAQLLFSRISLNPRYFMTGAPALFALFAAGFPRRESGATDWIAGGLVVALMLAGTAIHIKDPGAKREDVAAAGRWLDDHVPSDRVIVITSDEMQTLAIYHWPNRVFRLYPPAGTVADAGNSVELVRRFPFDNASETYFLAGRAWVSDRRGDFRSALLSAYGECEGAAFRGIRIYCLKPSPAPAQ